MSWPLAWGLLACGPSSPEVEAPAVTVDVGAATSSPVVARTPVTPSAPKPPTKKPFRWFSALGLAYGDDEGRLSELFGQPSGRDGDVVYFSHVDDPVAIEAFNITLNPDGTIYVIALGSPAAAEALRERGVDEELLDLVGAHADVLREKFGPPDDSHSDTHTWKMERGPRRAQLMAFCYDFESYACNTVWLSWFY